MTFPAHFSRSEIGRVNQLLKRGRGISNVGCLQLRHEISESRWLAGVWYARLAMPDLMVATLHDNKPLIHACEILHVLEDVLLERTQTAETHRQDLYVQLIAELKAIGHIDTPRWADTLDHFYSRHMVHRYKKSPWSWQTFWRVVDLTMIDYRMKNRLSRTTRRWQKSFTETPEYDRPMYIACSYCGIRLYQPTLEADGISDKDYTRQTNNHTLTCALWFMMHDERVVIEPGGYQQLQRVGPNISASGSRSMESAS